MRDRPFDMIDVLDRRDASRDGRCVDVERRPDAIDRIADLSRRIAPAEPQSGKAVDLREGTGHHDVFARRDQLLAGRVIVAFVTYSA